MSSALSAEDLALLQRWAPVADDSMAMVSDGSEPQGRPWDNPDYVQSFQLEGGQVRLRLRVRQGSTVIDGVLSGIQSVRCGPHQWGTVLTLLGPVRWVGTRTERATGLTEMAAQIFPSLGQPKTRAFDETWPKMTLVLPCRWTP